MTVDILRAWKPCIHFNDFSDRFLSRVSMLIRDIDIAILSVRPSVRHVLNGLIYYDTLI